jgi:hypothetical protein
MKKFGDVLTSRQAGKEAYLAFLPTLKSIRNDEELIIDFEGINSFSPSWGDEFLTPIQKQYGDRLKLKNKTNLSVALTLSTLEKANGFQFNNK